MSNQIESVAIQSTPTELVAKWLLNSQIQNSQPNPKFKGGMHAWFDQDTKSYSFLYSEITGYSINAFLFLYHLLNEKRFLNKAEEAAAWLINVAYQPKSGVQTKFPNSENKESYFESWTFTFDNWIVAYGLANLFEVSRKNKYLEVAVDIADFLLSKTQTEIGMFYPVYNIQAKKPETTYDKWSRQPGSFHAKALLALLKLNKITNEKRYHLAAEKLALAVLTIQQPNGRFITHDQSGSTLLHPHLYTLEGLAAFGFAKENFQIVESVQKGIEWVLKNQNSDGSIYCFFENGSFRPYIRADILAQTLRMGSILVSHGHFLRYKQSLNRLRNCLITYQVKSGPQTGGYLYGQEENGKVHNHVNSWVSMFAAQALAIHDSFLVDNRPYHFDFFV